MALYNFQQRFWPFVKDGSKQHTIRSIRANPCKVGDTMYLYGGLRQAGAHRLIEPPKCTHKNGIIISKTGNVFIFQNAFTKDQSEYILNTKDQDTFNYKRLTQNEKIQLAWYDGARLEDHPLQVDPQCWQILFNLFKTMYTLPFAGHIDVWHPKPQTLSYLII